MSWGRTRTKRSNRPAQYGYKLTPIAELKGIALTSFAKDSYYRSFNATTDRIKELVAQVDPVAGAEAMIWVRKDIGMRVVPYMVMAILADRLRGVQGASKLYDRFASNPADVLHVMAYRQHTSKGRTNEIFPRPMVKGFRVALERFDQYQIEKYASKTWAVTLKDAVRLTHANSPAIDLLMQDALQPADTWETRLSMAKSNGLAKADVWRDLLKRRKLGFQAQMRNLRNIGNELGAGEMLRAARDLADRPNWLENASILPYQLWEAMSAVDDTDTKRVLQSMIDRSADAMPNVDGETLVIIDGSGSMGGGWNDSRGKYPFDLASQLASILIRRYNADSMLFATTTRWSNANPMDSLETIQATLRSERNSVGHGTDLAGAMRAWVRNPKRRNKYRRVFVLSDEAANGMEVPQNALEMSNWRTSVYVWNLAEQLGETAFDGRNVWRVSGFNPAIFRSIQAMDDVILGD